MDYVVVTTFTYTNQGPQRDTVVFHQFWTGSSKTWSDHLVLAHIYGSHDKAQAAIVRQGWDNTVDPKGPYRVHVASLSEFGAQ